MQEEFHIIKRKPKLKLEFPGNQLDVGIIYINHKCWQNSKYNTFPGIKQHMPLSMNLEYVMFNMDILVSIDVKMSQCLDSG